MNSLTHKLPILLLSVFIGLTACTVTDDPAVDPETPATPSVNTAPEPDYASVATDVPVFVSASIKPEVKAAMQTFLTKVTPLEEAEVAVVRDEDIGTYEGKLLELYERGGLVVVAQPVSERFKEFAGKYGLPDLMPFDASQDVLLYATSKNREHYVLCASTETLGSIGFSAEQNNTESMTLKDVSIALETKPDDGMVKYKYIVENVKSRDWDNIKAMDKDVPALARSDFNAKSMWCWRIKPSEANGLKDNSNVAFLL